MDVTDMGKEIYIVVSGEYSDYQINAVFSTRKLAKDYIQQRGTDYRIEVYELDKEVVKETKLWDIVFNIWNNKLVSAISEKLEDNDNRSGMCVVFDTLFPDEVYIRFYVDSDSMDRAVKIASERFAAIKANEYIWLRLTRPYEINIYGRRKYETFNVKTNEFTK